MDPLLCLRWIIFTLLLLGNIDVDFKTSITGLFISAVLRHVIMEARLYKNVPCAN